MGRRRSQFDLSGRDLASPRLPNQFVPVLVVDRIRDEQAGPRTRDGPDRRLAAGNLPRTICGRMRLLAAANSDLSVDAWRSARTRSIKTTISKPARAPQSRL